MNNQYLTVALGYIAAALLVFMLVWPFIEFAYEMLFLP